MSLILAAAAWIADGANWVGQRGIAWRLVQHLGVSTLVLVISAAIALPLGIYIGHSGRGKWLINLTGAVRAVPTLGLLTLFGLWIGIGLPAPVLALVALAIPPLLAGAYSGVAGAPPSVVDAARALGMKESEILSQIELPLAQPLLVAGLRSASLQVIATATLAAYTANYGLGRLLYLGLKTRDYPQMIAGAILVVALALLVDWLLGLCQHRIERQLSATKVGK